MPSARFDSKSNAWSVCFLCAFIVFWFSDTVADPDLWGHVRFGQDILRAGSIIQPDPYSYQTGDGPWINHEWLSEVIFAAIYNEAGPQGLIIFKVLASVLIIGLAHAHLRRRGMGPFHSVFLLLLLSGPLRPGMGTIRPQIFTYLFFLIELLVLERAARDGEAWLWTLPIVFAVWVNLHGGVLAGAGLLLLWIAIRLVSSIRNLSRSARPGLENVARLLFLGIVCGLALLLNPYGLDLLRFLLRTATVPRPEISEWVPLSLLSRPGLIYLGLLALGITGLAVSARRRGPETLLIFAIGATLPLVSKRHYPLFVLALVVEAGEHIADVANRWRPPAMPGRRTSRLASAFCLVGSLLLLALCVPRFSCIRIGSEFRFPVRAVALLKQSGVHGNMAVPYDWGEYVIWHLGPGVKVSIDGRRETVYSDEVYRQSRDFDRGEGRWDALLVSKPATDLVLTTNGSPTVKLLSQTAGWTALYQDTYATMFVRAGFPGLTQLLQTPVPALPDNGDKLCFPGPRM